ncbi:MAG TPA: divalent metal cation transporter [Gemmatimonadaceae bacterium]|nr:divalent metal cation transporter [Gemmatimonadaceae bacterium]
MKKIVQLALGIVTGIGGFLEIGSVTTAAQAGSAFGYQLIWALLLGIICLGFMLEMSGRFAAISKHTVVEGLRDRFGFGFFSIVLTGVALVVFLVLIAEIGGVALSIEMGTGVGIPWWAIPVAFLAWLLLWKGNLDLAEDLPAILGLITIFFAIGVHRLHPEWTDVFKGAVPTLPAEDKPHYWFLAVSILGASVSPYLMYFYSAGAVEEKWDESYLPINRFIAGIGSAFGGLLAVAVLIVSALVFHTRDIEVETFDQMARMMKVPFPEWGVVLFAFALGITCLGAAMEIALSISYMIGQGLGWHSSEEGKPAEEARFSTVYTVILFLAAIPIVAGVDPIQVTTISMALTSATLPLAIVPFLILMNDDTYCGQYTNRIVSNTVVVIIMLISFLLAIVAIPLQFLGGG